VLKVARLKVARRTSTVRAVALLLMVGLLSSCTTVSAVKPSKPGSPVAFSALRDRGTQTALANDVAIAIDVDDFSFGPTFVRAAPGATVELVLTNDGHEVHSFVIDSYKVKDLLKPGIPVSESVVVPNAGSLIFYCRFHRNLGMQGAIVATPRVAPPR
jgi:plastocyanin